MNKVELKNFVSHRHTVIDFGLGVTAIVGPNGAGKTSILDAISYALFNLHSRGALDYLVNRASQEASVKLWFTSKGRSYLVEWQVERGRMRRTRARLYEELNGSKRLLADGPSHVLREVEKVVDVDKELFTQAMYVKQGEVEALVEARPAERKRIVSRLLGIDDLEAAWEAMRDVIDDQESKLRLLEAQVAELGGVEEELKRVEGELIGIYEEQRRVEASLERARVRAESLRALLQRYEEAERKYRELEASLIELNSRLEKAKEEAKWMRSQLEARSQVEERLIKLRPSFEEYEELQPKLAEAAALKARMAELEGAAARLRREAEKCERKLRMAKERLERRLGEASNLLGERPRDVGELATLKDKALSRLEAERKEVLEGEEELRRRVEELAGRAAEREHLLEKLSLNPRECPVCGRDLTKDHLARLVAKLRAELAELSSMLVEARREEARLREYGEELSRRIEALRAMNVDEVIELAKEVEEVEAESEKARFELEEVVTEVQGLKEKAGELMMLEARLRELEPLHRKYLEAQGALKAYPSREELLLQIRSAEAAAEELEVRINRLRHEQGKLGYSEEAHAKLREELRSAEEELRKLAVSHAELKARREYLEARRGELRKKLDELREKMVEKERRARFVKLLEEIRWSFSKDGLQRLVRAKAKPVIEHLAREYLEKFNLEYSDVKLDEDFNPTLLGPLGEQPVDSISGGERVAVALALRLAIARALAGERVELMILDEPTVHLDEERRRELVEVLRRFFREEPRVLPQLVLVTHEREVEEAADLVYYVTREAGFSKVSSSPP